MSRAAAPTKDIVLPPHALVLVMALAAAVVAQGGYYLPGRILAAVLVAVALVVALRTRHWSSADPRLALLACCGLAAWAVVRAAVDGDVVAAVPTVVSAGCLVGALLVAQRTDASQRELCAVVAVGIGVLVAVSGWIAVVWRIPSWATVADGLFRASSTLTYPNAAAALLASLAMLAVSLQLLRPQSLPRVAATYVLLVGLGATLSRAGVLALLVGLVILSLLAGVLATVRQVAPPGLGAVVALGALAPSFPGTEPARPAIAMLGLVAGLVIAVGVTRLRGRVQAMVQLAAFAGTAIVVAINSSRTVDRLLHGRVALSSPDRADAASAALDIVAAQPVTGVGPGQALFSFTRDGQVRVIRYAHNEYLQVLVELGAIGLGLVLLLLVAVVVFVRRGRRYTEPPTLWAGAVAAVAVLLVHSGFDFLWHIPVILLAAGLFIGLAGPSVVDGPTKDPLETKEKS